MLPFKTASYEKRSRRRGKKYAIGPRECNQRQRNSGKQESALFRISRIKPEVKCAENKKCIERSFQSAARPDRRVIIEREQCRCEREPDRFWILLVFASRHRQQKHENTRIRRNPKPNTRVHRIESNGLRSGKQHQPQKMRVSFDALA